MLSQKSINALITLVVTLACGESANLVAEEKSKAVTVTVICDDDAAKKMIHDSLLTHFRALRDLEVVEKGGYSSLIVYAEKTVNDPRNPNGYVFAIAHTNSYELRLAHKNLRGIDDVKYGPYELSPSALSRTKPGFYGTSMSRILMSYRTKNSMT